jgi:hypothetical protein
MRISVTPEQFRFESAPAFLRAKRRQARSGSAKESFASGNAQSPSKLHKLQSNFTLKLLGDESAPPKIRPVGLRAGQSVSQAFRPVLPH